jgi:hypothetical protein
MEVGLGPNEGCSAKGRKMLGTYSYFEVLWAQYTSQCKMLVRRLVGSEGWRKVNSCCDESEGNEF